MLYKLLSHMTAASKVILRKASELVAHQFSELLALIQSKRKGPSKVLDEETVSVEN